MNPRLRYLQNLYESGTISEQSYIGRANMLYSTNPKNFSEEDIDFIEKLNKDVGVDFNRDMAVSESNLGSVLNQFASGVAEGFTTLGWAEEADTTTEGIANKVGHLVGFAPDIISSVLSMGALVPGIVAKRGTAKLAVKRARGRPTKKATEERLRIEESVARNTALAEKRSQPGRKLTANMGSAAAKIQIGGFRPFAKAIVDEGAEKVGKKAAKDAVEEITDIKGWQIRSIPMRIADKAIDSATNKIADTGLLSQGFFSKALFKNEQFQKVARESAHLGVALGASAVWKGPKAIAESTFHGALAGAVFGGIGEWVNVSRLIANPKTEKLGKDSLKILIQNKQKEEILNAFARGTVGSAFQGGMSTVQGAPLPDQMYEYLMGFFFGAHTKSVNELKLRKIIMENPMLDGTANIGRYKKQIEAVKEYQDAPAEVKQEFERHIEVLFEQQAQQNQRVISGKIINREIEKVAKEENLDVTKVKDLKKATEIVLENDKVKDLPNVDRTIFKEKIESDKSFLKEMAEHKKGRQDALKELNEQLLQELGIDFASVIEAQKSSDIVDPISINRALEGVYKEIKNDARYEGYSRADLKRILLKSVYNAKSYTSFVKDFKSIHPNFEVKFNQVGENPLRTFFIRTKTYAETSEVGVLADGTLKMIRNGAKNLEVDADGKNLVAKESPNGIDIRYGKNTRLIVRLLEKEANSNKYEAPLDMLSPSEAISKLQKQLYKKGYYIYGAPKDKGTIIAQKIPEGINPQTPKGKKFLDMMVDILQSKDIGVPKKFLKKNNDRLYSVSNLIYKLVDNGYLTGTGESRKQITEAVNEFKKDVIDGKINIDVLKEVKYEPLYQGKGIPVPSEAMTKVLDNLGYIDGQVKGFLNMIAIKDKILKRYDKEYESGTDGGLIIRDDVFDLITDVFGMSRQNGFIKPVVRASAREGKGEIRGKVGGFRPESEGLNKFMMDNNIHMMMYGSGLKSKGKLSLNELIDGKNDTWSLKESVDIAKIRAEELLINPDVNDYVFKNLIEINERGMLKIYKQLLDKNTFQDFPVEYFNAVEVLKEKMMAGNEAATKKFIESGQDFVEFRVDDISIQSLVDSLIDNPVSLKSKKIIRDILENTRQDEMDLSDSMSIDPADLVELGLTPEILKRTNHAFNTQLEYKNFISNKLARYILSRGNQIKVKHGFKAYSGLYTQKMQKDFNLKDNEFMLGDSMRDMLITVKGVKEPVRLEDAFDTFQKLNYRSNRKEYMAYKEALTYLIMRTPNSGNGGVRALEFVGFKKKGGFNFFANELNSEYLGGKDNDGDTVTGYQSLPGVMKKSFGKDNVFYELNDGDVNKPTKDLKAMEDKYNPGKTIADTRYGIDFGESPTGSIITKVISGMQSGADVAGLYAAEALGISTGGNGTKGHISEAGKTPKERTELAKRFNIEEGQSTSLPQRTMKNVVDSNATIAFRTQASVGTDKTIGFAQTGKWSKGNTKEGIYNDGYKPVLVLNSTNSSAKNIKLIKDFIKQNPGVVNIAGSRESSVPGSQKQIQKLLEISFKELQSEKVSKKTFGEQLGEMLSSEMRLKAGKAAYEGKKAVGTIVNATTEFQMMFDMIKNNGGVIELGSGYQIKIRLDDFNFLKDVSYVGINTAVDSSEYISIRPVRKNVEQMFQDFFKVELQGQDVTSDLSWYKFKKDASTIMPSFRNFAKAISSKKEVTFNLDGERSLYEQAQNFIFEWGKFGQKGDTYSNYYLQTARKIADIEMTNDIFSFDFARGQDIVAALDRTYKNVKNRKVFEELGIADLYRDLNPDFILKSLAEGKNLRGKANNIIGLDLLTKQGEIIIDLLEMGGYRRDGIVSDLQRVVENTFLIKQKGLNKIDLSKEIIAAKQALTNTIEAKLGKGKKLTEKYKRQLFRFYDFALLSHPVVKLGANPKLDVKVGGKEITLNEGYDLIKKYNKEIDANMPAGRDMEYSSVVNGLLKDIRTIENSIDRIQEKFTFESPAIDPLNTRLFFTKIDDVYSRAAEINAGKNVEVEVESGTPKKPTKEKLKLEDINEEVVKEIEKDTGEKVNEIEVEREVYKKITSIDFDKALSDTKITTFGRIQLMRLKKMLKNNPHLTRTIDAQYEMFLQGTDFMTFQISKEFTDATAKDLKRFNDYMESIMEPGAIKKFLTRKYIKQDPDTGQYKVVGAPGWASHFISNTLKNQLKFAVMQDVNPDYQKIRTVVLDKNGNIKLKDGEVPISTLEYNTNLALAFHRLGNSKDKDVQNQIEENLRLVKPEDSKQAKDFNLLFKYLMYAREYNNGKFYSGIKNQAQKDNITKKYNTFKKEYDRMIKEGLTFKFEATGVEKGQRTRKGVEEVGNMVNDAYTNLMTQVLNDVIKSRHSFLKDKLKSLGKKVNEYKIPKKLQKQESKTNVEEQIKYEIQQLEMTFLDKNGLLSDATKIDALYAGLSELVIRNPSQALTRLPSITDVNFFRYYQRLNDHLSRKFPEINFEKQLSKKEFERVKTEIEEYKKILKPNKSISIGRYEDSKGVVSRFVPHTGAFDTIKRAELNGKAIDDIIEAKINRVAKNEKLLARIDAKFATSARTEANKAEAIARYREYLNNKYAGYRTKGVNPETDVQELAVVEDFTLTKPMDVFKSNSNLRSRGSDVSLPEWNAGLSHVESYVGAQYRNLLNSNLSLKINSNIKRFVKKNPFGTDKNITESWAYFMMDVAKNQMGLPSLRNFDIHGITKDELGLLKKYMNNKMKQEGLGLSVKDKDFLARIEANVGLSVFQKAEINTYIKKASEKKTISQKEIQQKAENMAYNLRLKNLKDLAQGKNVNKIGRFHSAYQLMTDESVVNFTEKMDRIFGGKLLKDAPTERTARDRYIAQLGQKFNALEGQFEMMSLLFHPKTFLTNLYGGFTNTITDVGLKPFTRALKDEWWEDNVWGENTTYTIQDSATGKQIKRSIRTRKDWEEWQAFIGIFEDMLINEAAKDARFQKQGLIIPFEQAAKRINRLIGEKGLRTNKKIKEFDDFADLTLREAAKEAGVWDAIKNTGATFMRSSEFLLRSRTWDAAYINARKILGEFGESLPFDSPILIEIANRTVESSQFIYHATQRPNIANTSLGRVMTRFHPYAWNSIGRRIKAYKGGFAEEWSGGHNTQRAQRQLTADLMSLALANIFVASIFDYALSPPMNWMQDTASLLFGDKKARDRAFFSPYPHPILSPLTIVTPPVARFVLNPITALLNNDFEDFQKYTLYTYAPFGRFYRDAKKTINSPAMTGEFMFGVPVHTLHRMRQDYLSSFEEEMPDEEQVLEQDDN